MHRTLRKGLAVVGASAAMMMVCGFGQASAAEALPDHHGSAANVTASDNCFIEFSVGNFVYFCI